MTPEEIKVGETYNVRVRVKLIEPNRLVCQPLNQDGTPSEFCPNYFNLAEAEAFYPINAENDIKSAKNAQKHDPCRLFRKGDKVRVVERMGRRQPNIPLDEFFQTELLTVSEDENFANNLVKIKSKDGREKLSHWWYLELVTPVEELEVYIMRETEDLFYVYDTRTQDYVSSYSKYHHPHAKEAAEAERDRLNAEYRKEEK